MANYARAFPVVACSVRVVDWDGDRGGKRYYPTLSFSWGGTYPTCACAGDWRRYDLGV